MINIENLKQLMKDITPRVLEIYNSDLDVQFKSDNSPLTEADLYVNTEVCKFLEKNYNYPILSEEGKNIDFKIREEWNTFWLIDPIDGTKEFVKKNGEFTVNIALIENNIPIFGLIYIPVSGILYYGSKEGSFKGSLNSETFERLPNTKTKVKTFVASRSHMSEDTKKYIESFNCEKEIVAVGSSIKLCLVAEGSADIYPRFGPTMEWDIAAGHAIVNGAGKNVKDLEDKEMVYNKENLLNSFFIVN